jgi:CheY-like chemotaxis protein
MTETDATRKKILVVDDERHIVTYLETLLSDNGYETVAAFDGEEALEKARTHKPDLVSLDITMPKASGMRFYRELKNDPDLTSIPVLIVTAVTGYANDPDEFKKFMSTRKQVPPPEGFVAKPIDKDELLRTVADLLT